MKAKVNGATVEMKVPAQMINVKTMVPLRFVLENRRKVIKQHGANFGVGFGLLSVLLKRERGE